MFLFWSVGCLAQRAGVLNVGTGVDLTIRELAEAVASAVSFKGEIVWDSSKPDGTPKKQLDVSRLAAGWRSKIPLQVGKYRRPLSCSAQKQHGAPLMPNSVNRNLVTGGAGFVGSHLVDRLMDAGEEVVVLTTTSLDEKPISLIGSDILALS